MSEMNSDQLHRMTLGIYSSLMDEFNPSLQKLVLLGNSYTRAFQALVVTSEAYFSTLSRMGERALRSASSQSIGEILIQLSENQRRLTLELEGVFRWFEEDILQEMDNNVNLDKDYIASSRTLYEMRAHSEASALDAQLQRGTYRDCRDYVQFLRESNAEALKEEERRYRFLAEKHCSLLDSISNLMNKTGAPLQQRADILRKQVNATRKAGARQPTVVDSAVRRGNEEQPVGKAPSRAPSPQGSVYRSGGESAGGGTRAMRAKVAHQPGGSNATLLPFSKGEMITVLVQQPRKGWLFGRGSGSSRQGWFPASYVEEVDDPPRLPDAGFPLRASSSTNSFPDMMRSSSWTAAAPPPPPPPPPLANRPPDMQPKTPGAERRGESNSQNQRQPRPQESLSQLFARGANPFATVKLRPTLSNDRSAPRLHR